MNDSRIKEFKVKIYSNSPGDMEVEWWTKEDWNKFKYEKYDPPLEITVKYIPLPYEEEPIFGTSLSRAKFYIINLGGEQK